MKEINVPTTDHIRQGYVGPSWDEDAELEFDSWLVSERHRVAQMAMKRERDRITINILDRVRDLLSCTKDDNCQEFGDLIESYIEEWIETE